MFPEFKSSLGNPNPFFAGFMQACIERGGTDVALAQHAEALSGRPASGLQTGNRRGGLEQGSQFVAQHLGNRIDLPSGLLEALW